MKKIKWLSLLLALVFTLQPLSVTASASEVTPTQTQEESLPTPLLVPPEEIPFGKVCVQKGCRTLEAQVPLAGTAQKLNTAQAALLFETTTETMVYAYNPDVKMAPGNLTKLVVAAVVMQHCQLEDTVTVNNQVNRLPNGARGAAGLKNEEVTRVKDLLYSMILLSAHDSAVALAVHVAGNQQSFVTLMNNWVAQLGCKDTHFGNVHGLSNAECTTTAREMAKIFMAAMEIPELKEILSAGDYSCPATNKTEKHSFRTQNYMISDVVIQTFYDDRCKAGMIAFDKAFGASIVIQMESNHEDEAQKLKYVAVLLNAERTFEANGWQPKYFGNYEEMTELLKMGFNGYKRNRVFYEGMAVSQFTVAGGECDAVGEVRVNTDTVVPVKAQMDNLVMNFKLEGGGLAAPIKAGDRIATVQLEYRGSVMTEAEVFAIAKVDKAGSNGITVHTTETKSDKGSSGFLRTLGMVFVIGLGVAAVYLTFNAYMRNRIRARRRKRRADRRRNY